MILYLLLTAVVSTAASISAYLHGYSRGYRHGRTDEVTLREFLQFTVTPKSNLGVRG